MSSVLSAHLGASLVDMDHSSDSVNAPSKTFSRDSSSACSPPCNSYDGSTKLSPPHSPPSRPVKLEQASLSSEFNVNVPLNGRAPDGPEEEHQVPSQASQQEKKEKSVRVDNGKEDSEWDDQTVSLGADPDEDPDFDSGDGDGDWTQDEIEADIRRVKVYELVDQKWTDRGTAFCQGDYLEKLREAKLVARAEHTNEILLECTIRSSDVYQRQQDTLIVWTEPDGTDYALSFQDIEGCAEVWEFILEVQRHLKDKVDEESNPSEGSSSMHMLSTGTMNPFSVSAKLPMPALGQMHECERAIRQNSRLPHGKEKLCDVLIQMDYVKHIIDVMQQAEDLEDIKELHACCSCMQTILMLNDHNLLEYVLQDHIYYGMVGVLEYDPEFPAHKAFYREFLDNYIQFRQPVLIREAATRQKIEQTYRLQFLKDVVLARATDDATFNVLNSCIIFNQIDIVNQVQHDERFLREVVGLFLTTEQGEGGREKCKEGMKEDEDSGAKGKQKEKDGDAMDIDQEHMVNGTQKDGVPSLSPKTGPVSALTPGRKSSPATGSLAATEHSVDARKKDTILLIQQLCVMGKNVQLPARLQLFRTLVDRGILHAVQWAIGRSERQMVSTGGEILTVLLDHDVNGVRQHVMKQVSISTKQTIGASVGVAGQGGDAISIIGKGETLLETLCRLLTTSTELAYKSQMADALRAVLEVPQTDNTDNNNTAGLRTTTRAKDDPVTERFLEYFYTKCCEGLFRPVSELPDHRKITEPTLHLSRGRSNLYLYLCDLLSSFALQHSYRSHFFIASGSTTKPPLVPRIASLLRAREKHLRLAALRFFRACLKLANRNMTLHLIHCDVPVRILELTVREAKWDNLLSSCCQEFFEHIRRENMKELISHLMIKYEAKVQELAQSPVCGQRFQGLIRRWEMNNEPPPKESDNRQAASTSSHKWGQGRMPELEEEAYFNDSEDEDAPAKAAQPSGAAPFLGPGHPLKRKRAKGGPAPSAAPTPKQPRKAAAAAAASPRLPLVDYDGDEDEDESDAPASSSSSSSSSSDTAAAATKQEPPSQPVDWFSPQSPADSPRPPPPEPRRLIRLGSPPPPAQLGEKRRRADEDDEDELLERLVRSKRQQTADREKADARPGPGAMKSVGPGKMRLKLGAGAAGLSLAASSPTEKAGAKEDADSGGIT